MFVRALAAALLGLAPVSTAPAPVPDPAIALVNCETGSGTAFSYAPGRWITARHVSDLGPCTINGAPTTLGRHDDALDVAELIGPDAGHYIEIRCREFRPGRVYRAIGYAQGTQYRISEVRRNRVRLSVVHSWDADGMAQLDGQVIPGMSGGPVLDDQGRALGIVNRGTIWWLPINHWMGSRELRDTFACRERD